MSLSLLVRSVQGRYHTCVKVTVLPARIIWFKTTWLLFPSCSKTKGDGKIGFQTWLNLANLCSSTRIFVEAYHGPTYTSEAGFSSHRPISKRTWGIENQAGRTWSKWQTEQNHQEQPINHVILPQLHSVSILERSPGGRLFQIPIAKKLRVHRQYKELHFSINASDARSDESLYTNDLGFGPWHPIGLVRGCSLLYLQKWTAGTKLKFLHAVQTSISSRTMHVQVILCTEWKTVVQNCQYSGYPTGTISTCYILYISARITR